MSAVSSLQARCAENIAALYFLGDIPEAPERHAVYGIDQGDAGGRQMPLEIEKAFVNILGFLSGIKKDPLKVSAVCVQEAQGTLCVMVAANAGETSNSPYLLRVKSGFDVIFGALREASTVSREELEGQVVRAIMTMCHERILARTRLKASETRHPLQGFLQETLEGLRRLNLTHKLESFGNEATSLIKKMDNYPVEGNGGISLQDKPYDSRLEEIVRSFYQLSRVPNLDDLLLNQLGRGKRKMDPSSSRALLNNIEKLSQYISSAQTLVKLARACPLVRRASTLIITLEASAFRRPTVKESTLPTLDQTFKRITESKNTKIDFADLCGKLQKPVKSANESYKRTLKDISANAKVHAEVQLISYLDAHQSQHPPRIIASNKDACYLCNIFITFHGKHTISKSHGKLYPGWRLPATAATDLQQRFNHKLEEMIVDRSMKVMYGKIKKFQFPLESTKVSAAASMNTVLTIPDNVDDHGDEIHNSDSDDTITPGSHISEMNLANISLDSSKELVPVINSPPEQLLEEKADCPTNKDVAEGNSSRCISSKEVIKWKSVSQGQTKCGFASDMLCIFVEYSASHETRSRPLNFRIWHDTGSHDAGTEEEDIPMYELGNDPLPINEVTRANGARIVKVKIGDEVVLIELDSFERAE